MAAELLDGRKVAAQIREEIKEEVERIKSALGRSPSLVVLRVGEDPASVSYAGMLERTCKQVGVGFIPRCMAESDEASLLDLVRSLSGDDAVDGIIIQEPLPEGIDRDKVIMSLSPDKDVDGVHPYNAGRLMQGTGDFFAPATPSGGIELLNRYGITVQGKRAVVVGRSNVVGRPLALMLMHRNATITVCHSRTADLAAECRRAEILAAATGRAGLITADMISPGTVVVDFGVNFVDGKMVGDVDFAAVAERASWITPVPGGTGPVTNMMLMQNVIKAARRRSNAVS